MTRPRALSPRHLGLAFGFTGAALALLAGRAAAGGGGQLTIHVLKAHCQYAHGQEVFSPAHPSPVPLPAVITLTNDDDCKHYPAGTADNKTPLAPGASLSVTFTAMPDYPKQPAYIFDDLVAQQQGAGWTVQGRYFSPTPAPYTAPPSPKTTPSPATRTPAPRRSSTPAPAVVRTIYVTPSAVPATSTVSAATRAPQAVSPTAAAPSGTAAAVPLTNASHTSSNLESTVVAILAGTAVGAGAVLLLHRRRRS